MFFIQWISFLSLYFSFLHQTNLCILPFGYKRCELSQYDEKIICYMTILSPYRQKTCTDHRMSSLMVSIDNYALFYPPFTEILEEFIKGYQVQYVFLVDNDEEELTLQMDFVHLKLVIVSSIPLNKIHLIIHSSWEMSSVLQSSVDLFTLTVLRTNRTRISNENLCYNYFLDNQTQIREEYLPCPINQCGNETRLCLGLTPCSSTGMNSYLCRIDQLRINDRFHCPRPCFYNDVIIITSENQTHQVSANLLNSCIGQRLVFVIIYGRLEIPKINSTVLRCANGLVGENARRKNLDCCSV